MNWFSKAMSSPSTVVKAFTMASVVRAVNKFRDTMNPQRGLTIQKAVGWFEAAQRGEMAEIQWAFAAPWTGLEVADPTLLVLIERRVSALQEMDWDIKIATDGSGQPLAPDLQRLAEDQAGVARSALDRIDNLYAAIEHLELAAFRQYAHLQPINSNGTPTLEAERFNVLPQVNFVRDGSQGDWFWNPDARATSFRSLGEERRVDLKRDLIIYREVSRFINRFALIKHIRTMLSDKDWDGFIEIFGIPSWIITGPQGMTEQQKQEFLDASENLKDGTNIILPPGSTATTAEGVRGVQPFEARLEYLDRKLVLAGTGGMLTMLNGATGIGQGATGAHEETFKTLARGAARQISEVIQTCYIKRLLEQRFPGQPQLAYFEIAAREEQDIGAIITHAAALPAMGYRMKLEQLAEKTGYQLEAWQPVAPAVPMTMNSAPPSSPPSVVSASLVSEAVAQTLGVRAELLKPLFAPLDAKAAQGEVSDADLLDALEALAEQLPGLASDQSVEEQAQIIQGLLGAGLVNQVAAKEDA